MDKLTTITYFDRVGNDIFVETLHTKENELDDLEIKVNQFEKYLDQNNVLKKDYPLYDYHTIIGNRSYDISFNEWWNDSFEYDKKNWLCNYLKDVYFKY